MPWSPFRIPLPTYARRVGRTLSPRLLAHNSLVDRVRVSIIITVSEHEPRNNVQEWRGHCDRVHDQTFVPTVRDESTDPASSALRHGICPRERAVNEAVSGRLRTLSDDEEWPRARAANEAAPARARGSKARAREREREGEKEEEVTGKRRSRMGGSSDASGAGAHQGL